MRLQGSQLTEILRNQGPAVTMIDEDGRPHSNLSPRHVADLIDGGDYWGFGKHGVIERVRPAGLKLSPFATNRTFEPHGRKFISSAMGGFPQLPVVQKNPQARGAAKWAPQPANARTGSFGTQRTLHFGRP
ncbi:hypothetical protein [uncultured Paludibaculum sp.]|uniref:hypothetical protein n=1 Tax=uncultured Paludibaculum sp. TaxID=1765020 RepID=UPI002AAB56C5|nr:hypothetical protein [uncultured Paludibaculum sp.]